MYSSGAAIGSYEILEHLGQGGMGVVYRARHRESGGEVALKTVLVPNPLIVSSMRREIQRLRRLSHPGVIRIVDDGVHEGLPWFAMELLEGETWEQVARRRSSETTQEAGSPPTRPGGGPDPFLDTAAVTTVQPRGARPGESSAPPIEVHELPPLIDATRLLCDALAYIHGEGVVHRDLKPANVFLRDDGQTVLVDFGLVVAHTGADGREVLQVAPALAGTLPYMAPEHLAGDPVDARADIFALGCMLYESLTGRLPFPAALRQRLRCDFATPPAPSQLAPCVPEWLDALVLRMLARDRRERLGHAWDVSAALAAWGDEEGPVDGTMVSARTYLYQTSFAGRDALLGNLVRRVEDLKHSIGGRVLVGGESGSGKTRLMTELVRRAATEPLTVVAGECAPLDLPLSDGRKARATPLAPLRPLLQTVADFCNARGEEATLRLLGRNLHVLAPFEPSLATLPGAKQCPEAPPLPIEAEKRRVINAAVETLLALARQGQLLLLLDDLQWADDLTLDVLAQLEPGVLEGVPLLVIGSYRTEENFASLAHLAGGAGVFHAVLDRLDAATVGVLITDMLGAKTTSPELGRFVAAHAVGNPFFVSEYLRAAVEEGLLRRNRRGEWCLADDGTAAGWDAGLERLELPRTLRAIVERRLHSLGPEPAELVASVAVLGREADAALLAGMSRRSEHSLADALNEVLRRQILEPAGGGRYRFTHDKLREAAYDAIPSERRRELHRAAAEAIEARGVGPEDLMALASHWSQAEVPDKARGYLLRAGERAIAMGAHGQAASLLERAIQLADEPGANVSTDERARLHRGYADALFGTGEHRLGAFHAARALELHGVRVPTSTGRVALSLVGQLARQLVRIARAPAAVTSADPRGIAAAQAAVRLASCYVAGQRPALQVVMATLLAANLADESGGPRGLPYSVLGCTVGFVGLDRLAQRYFARARDDARRRNEASLEAVVAIQECALYLGTARWPELAACSDEAIAITNAIEDQLAGEAHAIIRGTMELVTGRLDDGSRRLEATRKSAGVNGAHLNHGWASILLGVRELWSGRPKTALTLSRDARSHFEAEGSTVLANALAVGAAASLSMGDRETALADASQAVEILRRGPLLFQLWPACDAVPWTLLGLWEAAVRDGRTDAASLRSRALAACALATTLGRRFPIGAPLALRAQGSAARIDGRPSRARARLERAIERAHALGMPVAEATARMELSRVEPEGSPRRAALMQEARDQANAIGCIHWTTHAASFLSSAPDGAHGSAG